MKGSERQPPLSPENLNPAQMALYSGLIGGPRSRGPQLVDLVDNDGELQGPFGGFLLSPEVGDALQRVGVAVRYRTGFSERAREAAILTVAAHWDSGFERRAHEAVGRAVGLSDVEMRAIRRGDDPGFADGEEAAVRRLAKAMLSGDVDDVTWASSVPPLEPSAVFELTTLVGYYSTLALQMRVFRTDLRASTSES